MNDPHDALKSPGDMLKAMSEPTGEKARELLRLAGEATPGKWHLLGPPWGDGGFVVAGSDDPHQGTYICNTDDELMLDEHDERTSANTVADAKYIAAANPEAVSELARAYLDCLSREEHRRKAFGQVELAANTLLYLLDEPHRPETLLAARRKLSQALVDAVNSGAGAG